MIQINSCEDNVSEKENAMSEEDRIYEESVRRIQSAVKQSMPFGQAVKLIDVEDEGLRNAIIDDALKVLIAEMHFSGKKMSLKDVSGMLKLPLKKLEIAKAEMLKDVEAAAVESYKQSMADQGKGPEGSA